MEIDISKITYNGFGDFQFLTINSRNFIKNDLISINCGNVIQNAFDGEKYFSVYFPPNGNILKLPSRFFDILFYDKLISEIKSFELIELFLKKFQATFRLNNWYSDAYLFRLIGKAKLELTQRINIANNFNQFNPIQIIRFTKDKLIQFSSKQFICSIPFRLSATSQSILKVEEVFKNILDKNNTLDEFLTFFEIPEDYTNNLHEIELNYFTKINYFDYAFYSQNWGMIIEKWNKVDFLASEIQQFFDAKFRDEENKKRFEMGYNSVGSLFNETRLYNFVKNEFPNYKILSQFSPTWLKPQRFDIFIKELNIAIEYNGIQHYNAIDYFGGIEGLKYTQILDKKKRKKSKEQNVKVIDVKFDMDIEFSMKMIKEEVRKKEISSKK